MKRFLFLSLAAIFLSVKLEPDDASIRLLCTSGRVCEVVGHKYEWGNQQIGFSVECGLCGKTMENTEDIVIWDANGVIPE